MHKRYSLISTLLALLLNTSALHAQQDKSELRIGVIAGLTGAYADVFQNWVNGITLAHERHQEVKNAPRIKLYIEDDQFNSTKGLSAYRKLKEINKIDALLNGSSSTIGAIAPLVKQAGYPVIQLGEETEAPKDDNIIQIMPGNLELETALGKELTVRCPNDLAVFYTVHPTMLRFFEAFKLGYLRDLESYEMDPTSTDLRPLILKAIKRGMSCMAILAIPEQGALLVKQLNELGQNKIHIAFDANFHSGKNEYKRLLGDLSFLESATLVALKTSTEKSFEELYLKRFGKAPGVMADMGYDAFNLLVQHYQNDKPAWLNSIKSAEYQGVSGKISFDGEGIRRAQYDITTVGAFLAGS